MATGVPSVKETPMSVPRYKAYRSTTDKLNDAFERIADQGDEVMLPLYWTGSRDWIIIYREVPPQPVVGTFPINTGRGGAG
jgi:hypothetical protein